MIFTDSPLETLHEVLSHAQYEGFSDIVYDKPDYSKQISEKPLRHAMVQSVRRPSLREITIQYMFPQNWSSTALGHGGMGGAASTTAYTTVLKCNNEYLVYFGRGFAYKIMHTECDGFYKFIKDCQQQSLVKTSLKEKYDE